MIKGPAERAPEQGLRPDHGRWNGVTLLLCGPSAVGKSYLAVNVLAPEYGAILLTIDDVYTDAVVEAGMSSSRIPDSREAIVARRKARDGRWPDAGARRVFFQSYERHVRSAIAAGDSRRGLVVLEGGTLRRAEETEIIKRCNTEVRGDLSTLVRVTILTPYGEWLQHRVSRLMLAGREKVPVEGLTVEGYRREVERASPEPMDGVDDHQVESESELRDLMEEIAMPGT